MAIDFWTILEVLAIILLIIFWRRRNAVWGGLLIAVIIGLIITIIYLIKGYGFNWSIIIKSAVIGTMTGFFAELLGNLSNFIKKKNKSVP